MKIYQDTINTVRALLQQNTEWMVRYSKYVDMAFEKKVDGIFSKAQQQFSVPVPFQLYMSLSMMVNECSSQRTVFELRFHGQSVAKILVANNKKEVALRVKSTPNIYNILNTANMQQDAEFLAGLVKETESASEYEWHSAEAKEFRRIYAKLEEKIQNKSTIITGQPEHDMESMLLQNYAQKSKKEKEVSYIQPVVMLGTRARFQMPTPIKASKVASGVNTLQYSGKSGGGIDILARMGSGRNTNLAILELKDENKPSEPPEKAICQAIAYATFIRELLRSDCGKKWWEFFGFGGENVPNALELKAIIVMPNETNTATDFAGKELTIGGSEDKIRLEYIYRANPVKGLPLSPSIK